MRLPNVSNQIAIPVSGKGTIHLNLLAYRKLNEQELRMYGINAIRSIKRIKKNGHYSILLSVE